jgi:glycosyltransferase involved in cell wall biosynthesis
MRCCLVVTTYERPEALARVLATVARQSRPPDEVIVADDGSGPATAAVVETFAAGSRVPVRSVTQRHEDFRAGRIRNAAIAATDCDYVVLVDGDMLLHPEHLADHVALARPGHYSQGVRIPLDARATQRQIEAALPLPGPLAAGLDGVRRGYAVRSIAWAARLRRAANAFVAVKACNQGFWRRDLLAVNGFDEDLSGWGAEDKELCARLDNAGVHRQTLVFSAIAFHLAHAPAARDAAAANRARWRDTVRSGRTRCERGIDGHGPASGSRISGLV